MLSKTLFVLLTIVSSSLWSQPGYFEPWGKDTDLTIEHHEGHAPSLSPLDSPFGWLAEKSILFHQNILSPVDGPRSHFRPSSSAYMLEAIKTHGFMQGFIMGCDRLLRENDSPWVYRTIEENGKRYKWNPPPNTIYRK